jgi:cytochrome c oxidase assembly protein subunit 15
VAASSIWMVRAYRGGGSRAAPIALTVLSVAILAVYVVQSPDRWIQIENVRAEHGHRLLAGGLGVLLLGLLGSVLKLESDGVSRRLALAAFFGFLAQAALGGLTVILFLRASVYHALLAQIEFGLLVALTHRLAVRPASSGWTPIAKTAAVATLAIYFQILLGALVRHYNAALAMPTFPLPLVPESFTTAATLHGAHRAGAVGVLGVIGWTVASAVRRSDLLKPALTMAFLVLLQVTLGALIVWTERVDFVATAHVAVGSLLVATSLVLTLRSRIMTA